MFIIRLIILIALVSAVIFVYRKLTLPKQSTDAPPPSSASMKKCSQCGVHLPSEEALEHQGHFFCSQEHKTTYLNEHQND